MLRFQLCGIPCRVSLLFPALITTLLLCQDDTLTVACLFASLIHEGGHLLAMILLHMPLQECVLGPFGLRIRLADRLTAYGKSIWIALSGPLANVVAALVLWQSACVESALVHMCLAALNVLPVVALDGGEILYCISRVWGWEGTILLRITSTIIISSTLLVGVWLMWTYANPTLWIVGAYLAAMAFFLDKNEKNS